MNEFMKNFSLEGKIAFVTGASYGIGFAIANALSAAGATIVFNDINQDLVNKGLAAYEEKGIKAHGYVCDVTDEEAVQKTVAQIREEVGVIDILVNNAGIIKRIPMLEMSAADFRKVIDVDLNAPFIVSSWGMAMAKQSKNKELAAQFLTWATGKELAAQAMLANITMARSSVWEDKAILAKINPGLVETRAFAAKNGTPFDRPYMSAVGEARDLIGELIIESINT